MKINVYILAGGKSRRFGESINKAHILLKNKPLILHSADLLSQHFSSIKIVGKNKDEYEKYGYPFLKDSHDVQHPLVGIYTGLLHTDTNWNFFTACDMPNLDSEVLDRLIDHIPLKNKMVKAVAAKSPGGIQPLASLYHKSLANVILENQQSLDSPRALIQMVNARIVEFESDKPFENVNTPEEIQRLY